MGWWWRLIGPGLRLAGKYELLEPLDAGAMGQVWKARDHGALERDVAIKLIKAEDSDEGLQRRFRREARIASELSHPRIMRVFDADWHVDARLPSRQLFIVMELLNGRDLRKIMRENAGGLPVERALDLATQLADGLAAVHARSIVHRDLKPANLFVQRRDQLKICDFGLARDNAAVSQRDMANSVLGTPLYAPPEWWLGQPVLAAPTADLYAAGGIIYEMLTGRAPFAGSSSIGALMQAHLRERPVPVRDRNPEVPLALSDLVWQLLHKTPAERGTAAALLVKLQEISRQRAAAAQRAADSQAAQGLGVFASFAPAAPWEPAGYAGTVTSGSGDAGPKLVTGKVADSKSAAVPEQQSLERLPPPPASAAAAVPVIPKGTGDGQPVVRTNSSLADIDFRWWRLRLTISAVLGGLAEALTKSWEIALAVTLLAAIADFSYRIWSAGRYRRGRLFPGARRATSRQLSRMRRFGYYTLSARPIPDSREYIDHLVIGPTGVYAIDSEKWNPALPIRTWNGKKLYHGPASQKDRLDHAIWEANQASDILSGALGTQIAVQPALAIYGPKIPWDVTTIRNVDVFTGTSLRNYLNRRARMNKGVARLTREEIHLIYQAAVRVMPEGRPQPGDGMVLPAG